MKKLILISTLLSLGGSAQVQASDPVLEKLALLALETGEFTVDVVYKRANGQDLKLDLITARDTSKARPTLIYFHGGGWVANSKERQPVILVQYLAMGMNVVIVQYRLGDVSLAPAAVEDCRCALRWVYRNAKQYGIDPARLVLAGHSAGGHLALITGMLDSTAGLDNECPGGSWYTQDIFNPTDDQLKVAAILNFYGITDVEDLLKGENLRIYAVRWLGSQPNREEVARRVSPIHYVRPGLPPILTVHGEKDTVVPYSHAVRLHQLLDQAQVPNQLLSLPGAGHLYFTFTPEETLLVQRTVIAFLEQHGVLN